MIETDRGMRAVLRARSVREQDSRIGLQRALAVCQSHRDTIAHLQGLLTAHADGVSPVGAFRTVRASLVWVGEAIKAEEERLAAAQRVADAAHEHWSRDKVRVSAVENLLERRATLRRLERERRERNALDDVAGQMWLRSREAEPSPGP